MIDWLELCKKRRAEGYYRPSDATLDEIEYYSKLRTLSPLEEFTQLPRIKQYNDLKPQTHGSASFMKKNEVIGIGLDQQGKDAKISPYLGLLPPDDDNSNSASIFARSPSSINNPQNEELPDGNGHIGTFATTRAGKGTGQIAQNLLSWGGSVLVLDVKGENYYRSAGYRTDEMKQNVFRFAPFEDDSDIWNPILSIRANLNWTESTRKERCQEEEDARYLTNLLIKPSGSPKDVFWENCAKNFLEGLLLHVRTAEIPLGIGDEKKPEYQHRVHERSMREVSRLLTLGQDDFTSLLGDMCESKRTLIFQAGNTLTRSLSGDGETGQSIFLAVSEQIKVWSYERIYGATYRAFVDANDREPSPNDFTFSEMRKGNTSIYLIIPPEYLEEYCSVLRVMVGFALRELKDSYMKSKTDPEYHNKPPVLFILDEFPQLGHMSPIENGLSYLAGFGVRLWFFIQDISQLKLHYENSWQSILANTEFKSFFGVNDIETANLVSEMIGTTTVDDSSKTNGASFSTTSGYQNDYPSNYSKTLGSNSSNTSSHTSRRLMTPDEVMRMPHNKQLIFIKGLRPIFCDRPNYYDNKIWLERSKIPAPKQIDFYDAFD
jgi:type IV secretion system protein VirD4